MPLRPLWPKAIVNNIKVLKMSLAALKKDMRNVEALKKKFERTQSNTSSEFFQAGTTDAGNGRVTLRFMPPAEGESEFIVSWKQFSWKSNNGKSYWGKSRRMLGKDEPDPCQEYLDGLWNTGTDENKEIYRARKARLKYVANVYVIEDKVNPENNGKVFPFRFGPAIYKLIEEALNPTEDEFETKESFNPFDPFDAGKNFVLSFKIKSGFRNYDESHFESESKPLFEDEAELEKVYAQLKPVTKYVAEDQYESYDVLQKRLSIALGVANTAVATEAPKQVVPPQETPKAAETPVQAEGGVVDDVSTDIDIDIGDIDIDDIDFDNV